MRLSKDTIFGIVAMAVMATGGIGFYSHSQAEKNRHYPGVIDTTPIDSSGVQEASMVGGSTSSGATITVTVRRLLVCDICGRQWDEVTESKVVPLVDAKKYERPIVVSQQCPNCAVKPIEEQQRIRAARGSGSVNGAVVSETAAESVAPPTSDDQRVLENLEAVCGVGLYFGRDPDTNVSVKQGQQLDIVCKVRSHNSRPIDHLLFFLQDSSDVLGWQVTEGRGIRTPKLLAAELKQATGEKQKLQALQRLFGKGVPVLTLSHSLMIVPYQSLADEGVWAGVVPLDERTRFDELYNSVNVRPNLYVFASGSNQPRTFTGWLRYKTATRQINDVTLNVGFSAY